MGIVRSFADERLLAPTGAIFLMKHRYILGFFVVIAVILAIFTFVSVFRAQAYSVDVVGNTATFNLDQTDGGNTINDVCMGYGDYTGVFIVTQETWYPGNPVSTQITSFPGIVVVTYPGPGTYTPSLACGEGNVPSTITFNFPSITIEAPMAPGINAPGLISGSVLDLGGMFFHMLVLILGLVIGLFGIGYGYRLLKGKVTGRKF